MQCINNHCLGMLVLLLLVAVDSIDGYSIGCPPDDVRLVTIDDVEDSYVQQGVNKFENVLSISATRDPEHRYFYSNTVPNIGNLTFTNTFLLIGLTSYGYRIKPTEPDQYVLNFTFEYSDSITNPYIVYPSEGVIDNATETAFFANRALPAKRIRLTINEADMGGANYYYWKINLFGCLQTEGVTYTTILPSSTSPTYTQPAPLVSPYTPSVNVQPSPASMNPQASSFSTCINSVSRSLQGVDDTTTITIDAIRTVISNITVTVTETMSISSAGRSVSEVDSSCVPVIAVLSVVLVGAIVAWIVLVLAIVYWRLRNTSNNTGKNRQQRRGTLNEVTNITLYTTSKSNNDSASPSDGNKTNGAGSVLIRNQLYDNNHKTDNDDVGKLVTNEAYEMRNQQAPTTNCDNDPEYETANSEIQYESFLMTTDSFTQTSSPPPHVQTTRTGTDNTKGKQPETVYECVD